jgi:hypothetical protein
MKDFTELLLGGYGYRLQNMQLAPDNEIAHLGM